MKFLVPNYSCLQNPWLGGDRPQISVLYVLCPQLNLLNPPPNKIPGYANAYKWIVNKCKVPLRGAVCSVIYYDNIENAEGNVPSRRQVTSELARAPDLSASILQAEVWRQVAIKQDM